MEERLNKLTKGKKYPAGMYAAPFEGAYYRAMIERGKIAHNADFTTEMEIDVYFVDYGNSEKCQGSEIRLIPGGSRSASEKPLAQGV